MSDEQETNEQPEIVEIEAAQPEIEEIEPSSIRVRPHGEKRPAPIQIDYKVVEKLAGMQCEDQEIADWFNVSRNLITKLKRDRLFLKAIERGRNKGKVSVRMSLFRQATGTEPRPAVGQPGDPDYVPPVEGRAPVIAATIFYAKNFLGMRDVVENRHTGKDGDALFPLDVVRKAIKAAEQEDRPAAVN